MQPRPSLVLIPGAMAAEVAWRFQFEAFSPTRPVIIPRDHYALTSIGEMAEQIASGMPASFDLIGWSMGGYIAFELYPLVRERIRKMALLCTSARPESSERLRAREELLRSVEVEGLRAVYTRVIDENLVEPSRVDQGYKDEVIAEIVGLGEHTLRNQITAMVARKDARLTLKSIQHEVLVIGGSHDTVTPLECSTEITELLPRASLHVVQDAGHALPWERPAEVNGILRQFLDN